MKTAVRLVFSCAILLPYFSFSQWTQKASLPAAVRCSGINFSIGTKGYIGLGGDITSVFYSDLWEWNQATNTWTQKANFPGAQRLACASFSIGTKGYVGAGAQAVTYADLNDFWEWNQATNTWLQKANVPIGISYTTGFAIGTQGYIGTGWNNSAPTASFYEWNQATNTWTPKAPFPGPVRALSTGFSIGTKGYFSTGLDQNTNMLTDLWEWNQATNTWSQKAFYTGPARHEANAFVLGSIAYLGTGDLNYSQTFNDFRAYSSSTNTWSPVTNMAGVARELTMMFSIGCKGYVACGFDEQVSAYYNDLWEYTGTSLTAVINANPSAICFGDTSVITAAGGSHYLWNTGDTNAIITVSPAVSTYFVVTVTDITGSCSTQDSILITVNPSPVANAGPDTSICPGSSVLLNASGGTNYLWFPSTGLSNANIANPSASPGATSIYGVIVSNGNCSDTDFVTVTVLPTVIANAGPDVTICYGATTTLTATGAAAYLWNTGDTTSSISVNPTITTTYQVTGTSNNCTGTASVTVNVNPLPSANAGPDIFLCPADSAMLNASGGISYIWLPATGLSNPSIPNPIAKPLSTTTYIVTVFNGQCTNYDTVKVTVLPLPVVDAGPDRVVIRGTKVNLFASSNGVSFFWYPSQNLSCPACQSTDVIPDVTTTYFVIVTDAFGCSNIDSVTIIVEEQFSIYFPNVFTPNGDNNNEVFKVFGTGISQLRLLVFNRWGETIFESNDINYGWDGTYHNHDAEQGVYVFVAYYHAVNGKQGTKYGSVALIR